MSSKRGTTVVVILLVAVGTGLLAAGVCRVRAAANNRETENRMGKLGVAMYACNDARKCLPPAYDAFGDITFPASVHVHLLPFLEQDALYRSLVQKGEGNG